MNCVLSTLNNLQFMEELDCSNNMARRIYVVDYRLLTKFGLGWFALRHPDPLYGKGPISCLETANMLIRLHAFDLEVLSADYELVTAGGYQLCFHYCRGGDSRWESAKRIQTYGYPWRQLNDGLWSVGCLIDTSWKRLLGDQHDTASGAQTVCARVVV